MPVNDLYVPLRVCISNKTFSESLGGNMQERENQIVVTGMAPITCYILSQISH